LQQLRRDWRRWCWSALAGGLILFVSPAWADDKADESALYAYTEKPTSVPVDELTLLKIENADLKIRILQEQIRQVNAEALAAAQAGAAKAGVAWDEYDLDLQTKTYVLKAKVDAEKPTAAPPRPGMRRHGEPRPR
jgi:hypothetical protein